MNGAYFASYNKMHLIAHRGNLNGSNPELENHPDYLRKALDEGYEIETDVWVLENETLMLGHDEPQYPVDIAFLKDSRVWCHAKNLRALLRLSKEGCHVFSHDRDDYVLTSMGRVWAYPGMSLAPGVICVMPERAFYTLDDLKACGGVCTDRVVEYRSYFEESHIGNTSESKEKCCC